MDDKYLKSATDILKRNWITKNLYSFKICFYLAVFLLIFPSNVKSQLNVNITGSGYGIALNKDDIYYNPYGEYSNNYETSRFISLGIGYLVDENNLFSFESSFQQSMLKGRSFNPFPMSGVPDEWEWSSSEFTAYVYSVRAGLRYTRFFLTEYKIKPFISASYQLQKGYKRIEKGESRYLLQSQNIAKNEAFEEEYKLNLSKLHGDLRVGATYNFNEHFSLSLAVEISTQMISVWRYDTNAPVRKFEVAFPVSIHYLF